MWNLRPWYRASAAQVFKSVRRQGWHSNLCPQLDDFTHSSAREAEELP